MKYLLGYLTAICVLILVAAQSIAIPTFMKSFYGYHFEKLQIPQSIEVEHDELMRVTGEMLDYMKGRRDDLIIESVVGGEEREFFNEREKDHMADVYDLFAIGFKVRNVAFWSLIFFILLMIVLKIPVAYFLARCCREVLAGFISLAALLIIIIAIDFNRAFEVFHLMFFDNDLWLLDPSTDLLINIVPQKFFVNISIAIGVLISTFSIAIVAVSSVYLRRVSKFERYPGAAAK